MTTAVFAKAGRMADQVREESKALDPAKVLLAILFALPFALAWTARMVVRAVWTVFAWTWTAAVVGWRTAAPKRSKRT